MKYSEKWGDSIDAAVDFALQELKLTREDVVITVLEQPSKGFFGIGSKLAKVRVEEKLKEKPKAEPQKVKKKSAPKEEEKKPEEMTEENKRSKTGNGRRKKKSEEKPVKEEKKETKLVVSTKPKDLVRVEEHPAKEFLEKTFKEMGLEVSVEAEVNESSVYIEVSGKDTGSVIGKRGATLDAIQYLTSLVVNKGENEHTRVVVDAEGYRAKREATLIELSHRLAEKVKKTGRSARLEPMNPYERKVIHTTLQGVEGITTYSEGDEPYRKVVIALKK